MKILRISCMLVGFLFLVLSLSAQTFTTLYSFTDGADGASPYAGLIQATNGDFYGTTLSGSCGYDCQVDGTVFKITRSGTLTNLDGFDCDFPYSCPIESEPYAGLVQATDGNFYGTTYSGGANGGGTVFQLTPSGTLTTLYSFCSYGSCTENGANPYAGLIQATNGYFYGTTSGGGTYTRGTVFKITPSGTLTTLYSFCFQKNCTDGSYPQAGLVQATNGDFYGTTIDGGGNSDGIVFKISPSGKLTTLHSFDGTDGAIPDAGLVQATDGNFYGTTESGGENGDGTVFKITPKGALTTLFSFNGNNGGNPYAELIQATDGNFYGTTYEGGTYGYGTVFSLSVGLGPFVETNPTSGKVGTAVKILGTDLTGATSVTFNGTAAKFKVVSRSLIKTTVPEGATTGTVEVTTPKGTLKSNVVFRVKK